VYLLYSTYWTWVNFYFSKYLKILLSLKQLDIAFMQALQDRVNIIPVIAKADTLTPNELGRFKQHVIHILIQSLF